MRIKNLTRHALVSLALLATGVCAPLPAIAAIVTFHFTGRLTVASPGPNYPTAYPSVIDAETDGYTSISADLTIDTAFTGGGLDPGALIGSSTLSVTLSNFFLGADATFHNMTLAYGGSGVVGNFLVDWNGNSNIPVQVDWNVNGLTNAIIYGLQVGDKISGDVMSRDTNGDGIADTVVIPNLGSVIPYADGFDYSTFPTFTSQGPAPMAATYLSLGVLSGPFAGIRGYIDIGSGNSMTVTEITAVPVPAAMWLFGSGLLGLISMTRRKAA